MTDSEIIDVLGGTAAVARRLKISTASVSEMRKKGISDGRRIELAADIERATKGAWPRWRLRPADWHLIWPELIGTPGAPHVGGVAPAVQPAGLVDPGHADPEGLPAVNETLLDIAIDRKAQDNPRVGAPLHETELDYANARRADEAQTERVGAALAKGMQVVREG